MRWLDEVTLTWWMYFCETVYIYHISQVPFTTEEARELVPGSTWDSPQYAFFTPIHPDWDCNTIEGKRRPFVHYLAMPACLKLATRWLTNFARVYNIRQRENKIPAAFLDRVMETFLTIHPHGPWITRSKGSSGLSFCQSGNTSSEDKAPEGGVVRKELSEGFKDCGKESI